MQSETVPYIEGIYSKNVNCLCCLVQKHTNRLSYNTHSEFLPILFDALPVFDVLCKRSLSFMHTCITSDCHIVKNIMSTRYALEHGRVLSHLGRNALYCSLRYNFNIDNISDLKFDAGKLVWNHYLCNRSSTAVTSVSVLKDMLLFRVAKDQCLLTPHEIETIIQAVCIE